MSQTVAPQQPASRRFMTWMLRSPLHVFMGGIMLITVTGRKSGRAISTPVNYARDGDTLLVTSKADRTWWKNVRGGAKVTLLIDGKTYQADANAIEDHATVDRELLRFFRLIKRTIAGIIHLDKDGQPTQPEKFTQVAQSRVTIEYHSPRGTVSRAPLIEEAIMQLRLGFELDASVAHSRGEAVIDLDFSAVNGQAVVKVTNIKIDSTNVVLDVASRMLSQPLRDMLASAIEPGY